MGHVAKKPLFFNGFLILLILIFGLSMKAAMVASAQNSGSVRIALGSASSVPPGSAVDLSVNMTVDNPSLAPAAIQWDFAYNPTHITSIVWKTDGQSVSTAGKSVACSQLSPGNFRCMIFGFNTNSINPGILGTIKVNLAASSASSVSVNLSNLAVSDPNGIEIPVTATGGTITISQPNNITHPKSNIKRTRAMP